MWKKSLKKSINWPTFLENKKISKFSFFLEWKTSHVSKEKDYRDEVIVCSSKSVRYSYTYLPVTIRSTLQKLKFRIRISSMQIFTLQILLFIWFIRVSIKAMFIKSTVYLCLNKRLKCFQLYLSGEVYLSFLYCKKKKKITYYYYTSIYEYILYRCWCY